MYYSPFGLNMDGPWRTPYETDSEGEILLDDDDNPIVDQDKLNRYQYNGKELTEDLDLNWNDYGARWYDPAIGRFSTQDRFAEKYYSMTPYQYGANNPIKFIDVNGDSLRLNFIGEYSQHAENQISRVINNGLEGQFRLVYRNVEYDDDNEIASGTVVIVPTEGGGDLSKMSLNGQEFYRELTSIAHEEDSKTVVNVDYARSDIHTGNFGLKTIDMADVLQFNKNLNELGGTQGGKIIHEFQEQYQHQALGAPDWGTAHPPAVQSENNVNLSVRADGADGTVAIQQYSIGGRTVTNRIITSRNRRVIKVTKQ